MQLLLGFVASGCSHIFASLSAVINKGTTSTAAGKMVLQRTHEKYCEAKRQLADRPDVQLLLNSLMRCWPRLTLALWASIADKSVTAKLCVPEALHSVVSDIQAVYTPVQAVERDERAYEAMEAVSSLDNEAMSAAAAVCAAFAEFPVSFAADATLKESQV